MPSRTRQDILRFPVRKTRSGSKCKKENQENIFELQSSERKISEANVAGTPKKSPRKIKIDCTADQENLHSPSKRKCSNNSNEIVSACLNKIPFVVLERTPLKDISYNEAPNSATSPCAKSSPTKLETGLRTPLKSRNSVIDLDSPVRRSPRKLEFGNSPSTLISRLALTSPSKISSSLNSSIGLHKPDLKVYRSLKVSLSCNSNNCIVGRETEISILEQFLQKHLNDRLAGSLYISGAPGTGKTASVTRIVDRMKNIRFKKVFLNCMSTKTSKEIFISIAKSLNLVVSKTEREIINQVERTLTSSKIPILIILDEVDQLESKNQDVLYTIFEWPSLLESKAVLVGIANMLDLTDRILPRLQANQSCRPQLLHFSAYNKAEIIKIINERIKEADIGEIEVIKQSAIHFLAAKVSAVAGDVRKALDVCRRAVELCEIQSRKQMRLVSSSPLKSPRKANPEIKKVEIPQVLSIFNDIYGSRVTKEFTENPNTFPLQQKVLICSLLLMLKHCKTKNATLGKFHEVYSKVCMRQKLPCVEQSEFFSLCTLLESRGMLQVKKSKEIRNSKILLRLDEQEAEQALGDKRLLLAILEDSALIHKTSHK